MITREDFMQLKKGDRLIDDCDEPWAVISERVYDHEEGLPAVTAEYDGREIDLLWLDGPGDYNGIVDEEMGLQTELHGDAPHVIKASNPNAAK